MEILSRLVEEIGPRPAGSAAEHGAFDWLEEQFRSAGLETHCFPVRFQPDPAFFPYYSIPAAGFALVALTLATSGWTTLLLPLLILLLPEGTQWLQSKLLPYKEGSSNLLVLPAKTQPRELDVILCAHIDSARAVPAGTDIWKKWRDRSMYTMMRAANLLIIPGLFQMMGIDIGGILLLVGQSLAWGMAGLLLAQEVWEQASSRGRFSPGANDNASGVSLLAAAALTAAETPTGNLKAGFLFTGAEECGLHGARQFAGYMRENGLQTPVISVDMVGAGKSLRIITRCGTVRPVNTNIELNELIKRADPLAEFHSAPRRWGDFAPFIQAGIPASHIENGGTSRSWSTYHTPDDTLDVIEPEMMRHVSDVLAQLFWILEKSKENPVEYVHEQSTANAYK
jgi:hypothetical protein